MKLEYCILIMISGRGCSSQDDIRGFKNSSGQGCEGKTLKENIECRTGNVE